MTDAIPTPALKACPLCGGPGHLDRFDDPPRGRGYHVVCHGNKYCPLYCSTPYSDLLNRQEAIAAWNTHEALSAVPQEDQVERLREALKTFTTNAVMCEHTHRVSVDEWVLSKAIAALRSSGIDGGE